MVEKKSMTECVQEQGDKVVMMLLCQNFKKIAESRNQTDYYIRGTFTKYNIDFCKDVIHMADLGFQQISVEPVVAEENMPYAITEKELPMIYEEYEKLAKELYERRKKWKCFQFLFTLILI